MNKEIFEIKELDHEYKEFLIKRNLWQENLSPSLDRFKILFLSYYNFNNIIMNDGILIAFDLLADSILQIFQNLLLQKFPINKIKLTSDYNGDDEKSMEDNNTSCFNCRTILGTSRISLHSLGMALDINPVQNPYIVNDQIVPFQGKHYVNRSSDFAGKAEDILDLMQNSPFNVWGGNWEKIKDYHHFEINRKMAELIAFSSYKEGKVILKKIIS